MQLVTRALALEGALNASHVALPVRCGFGDFIRVGQLLPLVRLQKGPGGVWRPGGSWRVEEGRGVDCKNGPPGCWSCWVVLLSCFSVISRMCLGMSGKRGGGGGRWKYVTRVSVYETLSLAAAAQSVLRRRGTDRRM